MADAAENQLEELRERLKEIRIAKKWLQSYRINAPQSVSASLATCYNWLDDQETKTIAMGKRIKASMNGS